MGVLFSFILFLSILFLILGLIKPKIAFMKSRKKVLLIYPLIFIVSIIGIIATTDSDTPKEASPATAEVQTDKEKNDSTSKDEKKDNKKSKTKKEEKTEFGIGEKAELKNNVVEITEVEKSSGDDFDTPKSGKEYVIVHITIENNGEKDISYNPFNFKMKNSNGQIEDVAFTTVDSDTSLSSGELAPGGNVSGTLAFEQPIDDPELQLIFEASFWSDKKIVFNLQ